MDLLYSRYASPISFMDSLIRLGKFSEGIIGILKQDNEDKMWELYLHSNPYVAPKTSFDKWKEQIHSSTPTQLSKQEVEATVKKSQNILESFNLKEGETK